MTLVVRVPLGNRSADALQTLRTILPRLRGSHDVVLELGDRKLALGGGLRVSNTPTTLAVLSEWGQVTKIDVEQA